MVWSERGRVVNAPHDGVYSFFTDRAANFALFIHPSTHNEAVKRLGRWQVFGGSCGYRIFVGGCRVSHADLGPGRGMCRAGEKEMSWAYALSGALALALLGYLVVALIRAEDL